MEKEILFLKNFAYISRFLVLFYTMHQGGGLNATISSQQSETPGKKIVLPRLWDCSIGIHVIKAVFAIMFLEPLARILISVK